MHMLWKDFFLNCFRMNWQTQNSYQFLACLYNSILVLIFLNTILLIYKIPRHFWSRCLFYDVIYILGIFVAGKYIWRKTTKPLLFYTDGIRYALICLEKNKQPSSFKIHPTCSATLWLSFSWLLLKKLVFVVSSPVGKLLVNLWNVCAPSCRPGLTRIIQHFFFLAYL